MGSVNQPKSERRTVASQPATATADQPDHSHTLRPDSTAPQPHLETPRPPWPPTPHNHQPDPDQNSVIASTNSTNCCNCYATACNTCNSNSNSEKVICASGLGLRLLSAAESLLLVVERIAPAVVSACDDWRGSAIPGNPGNPGNPGAVAPPPATERRPAIASAHAERRLIDLLSCQAHAIACLASAIGPAADSHRPMGAPPATTTPPGRNPNPLSRRAKKSVTSKSGVGAKRDRGRPRLERDEEEVETELDEVRRELAEIAEQRSKRH